MTAFTASNFPGHVHGGFRHLFGSTSFLWAIGTVIERRIDWKRFLAACHTFSEDPSYRLLDMTIQTECRYVI